MKATALLLAFVISMIGPGASKAASTMTELKGSGKEVAGFAFTISNEELPDGTVKFRVVVTGDALRFNKYSTGLSVVTIKEDRSGRTESITGSRDLPSEKQEHSIVCEFSVKGTDLANPNLCFVFCAYEPHGMPSADFVYARLNQFAHHGGSTGR